MSRNDNIIQTDNRKVARNVQTKFVRGSHRSNCHPVVGRKNCCWTWFPHKQPLRCMITAVQSRVTTLNHCGRERNASHLKSSAEAFQAQGLQWLINNNGQLPVAEIEKMLRS